MNLISQETIEEDDRIKTKYKFEKEFVYDDYVNIYRSLEGAGLKTELITVQEDKDMLEGARRKTFPSVDALAQGKEIFGEADIAYVNGCSNINQQEVYTRILPSTRELLISVPKVLNNDINNINEYLHSK